MNRLFIHINLLIFALTSVAAIAKEEAESEQIVVRLATDNQLIPLYLAKITSEASGFDDAYLKKLEKVLQFDLNHNGMTSLIDPSSEKERLTIQLFNEKNRSSLTKLWDSLNAYYAVRMSVTHDNKLAAEMYSRNDGTLKHVSGWPLTGELAQDRRQIHQAADAIHKALFGTDGIAATRLIYTLRKKGTGSNWTSEIFESDYDGENAHPIVKSNNGYSITPVYVPPKPGFSTGSIFYVSYQSAQPKIYVASIKEGIGRRFSYLPGNQLMPDISRQRDRIAFISDVTGNPDLFIQSFDPEKGAIGKPQQIFAALKATQGSPKFNPDGKKIAFVSNKDGSPRIYAMDIPTPGTSLKEIKAQLLTKHSNESSAPAWSPDGTKLAYCAKAGGFRQIWVYDFTTKQERQLTQGPVNKENPTWAPNSLHLMYNSSDTGACELYLINLNQPNATKITSGAGEKRFPNWEPRN